MNHLPASLLDYYREVSRAVPCSGRMKRKFLADFQERLLLLQEEIPDVDFETAQDYLGSAEEIAEAWADEISADEVSRKTRLSLWAKIVIVTVAVVAAAALAFFGSFYFKYQDAMRGDFIVDEILYDIPEDLSKDQLDDYLQWLADKTLQQYEEEKQ